MARKVIQVYIPEDSNLKERLEKVKGPYSETLFCYQAIEAAVEELEKKASVKK